MEGIDSQNENLVDTQPDCVDNQVLKTEVKEECSAEIKTAAGASTAEERCPICLEDFEDKAFIDACFHTFCFECILRWSETTTTSCPMCKTGFNKIIHNVRANDDYDVFKVVPKPRHPSVSEEIVDLEEALRSFRGYRTTRFSRQPTHSQPSTSAGGSGIADSMDGRSQLSSSRNTIQARGRRRDSRKPAAIERRKAVYSTGLKALPLLREGKPVRVRDVSAAFFVANPAATHRLYPWLNRELTVLVGEEHVQFVVQILLSLLDKIDMKSTEFASHLEPYLHEKTSHFMHELISYASSPYDMIAYDKNVSYEWPSNPGAPSHSMYREGIDTDRVVSQGTSVDIQQRIFDEITSTRWEDSPPIIETLSPSFMDHSSGSEVEISQEEILEVNTDQSGNQTRMYKVHDVQDQTTDAETLIEHQAMEASVSFTNERHEDTGDIADIQDIGTEITSSRTSEMTLECTLSPSKRTVEPSPRQTENSEPVVIESFPLIGTSDNRMSDFNCSSSMDNTITSVPVNNEPTDYEINVYVENEDDPSNQDEGDIEDVVKTKYKTMEKQEVRSHMNSSVALRSNRGDSDKDRHVDIKGKQRGSRRRRHRYEYIRSGSDSSDGDHRKRYGHKRDVYRRRSRSHSRHKRHRSISRGRPFNYGNDGPSPNVSRRNKTQTRIQESHCSRGSRSRSRSRSISQDHSCSSRSRISMYYQREKGHRSKLYSDEYPVENDDMHLPQVSERVGSRKQTEAKSHKCTRIHRKSDQYQIPIKESSTQSDVNTDKSQCELSIELSGLEEEIKANKRNILKSALRRERLELLHKNLQDLGPNSCIDKEHSGQSYLLDNINPVDGISGMSSTGDMQKELKCLEQAIVDGKKQLLKVMMKMEEDQIELETDDESAY